MVEDRGHTLLDAVDIERVGRGARSGDGEPAVDGPPRPVEHLIEVRRVVPGDGEAAGERGVDMRMGVDKRGHNHAATRVDDLGVGVLGAQDALLADGGDLAALIGHGAVLIIAAVFAVAGNQTAICHEFHRKFLLFSAWITKMFQTPVGFETLKRRRVIVAARARSTSLQLPIWYLIVSLILQETARDCNRKFPRRREKKTARFLVRCDGAGAAHDSQRMGKDRNAGWTNFSLSNKIHKNSVKTIEKL